MRTPDNNLPASVVVVCGATGSGKSHLTKQAIAREKNVLVFDVKNEYGGLPGFHVVRDRSELIAAAKRGGRIAYPAGRDEFEFFCRVAWLRGDALVVVEELASVTQPGKAVGPWHLIVTQGRGYGLRVIGITQRPMEIDKTIIGNATVIRSHRLTRSQDRRYVESEINLPVGSIDQLRDFDHVEFDVIRHRHRWSNARSATVSAAPDLRKASRKKVRKG